MNNIQNALVFVVTVFIIYVVYTEWSGAKYIEAMESDFIGYTYGGLQNPYDFTDPSGRKRGLYDYLSPNVSGRHVYYRAQDAMPGNAYKNCGCGCQSTGIHGTKPVNVKNVADDAIELSPDAEKAVETEMKVAKQRAEKAGKTTAEVKDDIKLAKVVTETEIAKDIVEHMGVGSAPSDALAMSVGVHRPAARARKLWLEYVMARDIDRKYSYIPNGSTTYSSPRRNVAYQYEYPQALLALQDTMPYSPYYTSNRSCSSSPAIDKEASKISQPITGDTTTPTSEQDGEILVNEPIPDSIKNEMAAPDTAVTAKLAAEEAELVERYEGYGPRNIGNRPSRRGTQLLACTGATVQGKLRKCGTRATTVSRLKTQAELDVMSNVYSKPNTNRPTDAKIARDMQQQGYHTDAVKAPSNAHMDDRTQLTPNYKQTGAVTAPSYEVVHKS